MLAAATLIGLAINFPFVQKFVHVTAIRALFWSAVINGVVAVPVMAVIMLMARNQRVMGKFVLVRRWLHFMGWRATVVMLVAAVGMFVMWKK